MPGRDLSWFEVGLIGITLALVVMAFCVGWWARGWRFGARLAALSVLVDDPGSTQPIRRPAAPKGAKHRA